MINEILITCYITIVDSSINENVLTVFNGVSLLSGTDKPAPILPIGLVCFDRVRRCLFFTAEPTKPAPILPIGLVLIRCSSV